MNNSPAIEVLALYRSFGETKAVQGFSFDVQHGEIFSLLGPNGAGKTTTISMLSCLLRPDEGDARVMGIPSQMTRWESNRCLGSSRRRSPCMKT